MGLGDLGLALLGLESPSLQPRRSVDAPPALRHALAGEYEMGSLRLKIWEAHDRLLAQATGLVAFELRYDSRGESYPLGFSALLRPEPPASGQPVARFSWHQGGGVMEGRRVGLVKAPPTIINPAWKDWAGEFQLAPQFSLKVFERDGRLMVQGTGQPAIAAEGAGKDRIEIEEVGATIEFERDADGTVVAAVLLIAERYKIGEARRGAGSLQEAKHSCSAQTPRKSPALGRARSCFGRCHH